jgi:hypothetical protein
MPTPQSTFFRPDSLSKGGTCKLNLRGNSFYDYANENALWTQSGGTIVKASVVEQTSWTYFIPKNYLFDIANTLTRDSLLTTSITNFTFMFRFYVTSLANPGSTGISIFFNGTPMAGGFWGVYVFGGSSATLNFSFIFSRGGVDSQTISTEAIAANTWYHVAVTLEDNGDRTSTFFGYLNGFKTSTNRTFAEIDPISGNTTLGNNGIGQSQPFQVTDIVFLEKILTAEEIKGYASSAFI